MSLAGLAGLVDRHFAENMAVTAREEHEEVEMMVKTRRTLELSGKRSKGVGAEGVRRVDRFCRYITEAGVGSCAVYARRRKGVAGNSATGEALGSGAEATLWRLWTEWLRA